MTMSVRIEFPLIFCIILSFLVNCVVSADTRQLSITYNDLCNIPACMHPQSGSFNNLVHVKAQGTNDTIHFLWSSIGAPAMLLARTTHQAKLVINWNDLWPDTKPGSISFEPHDEVFHASAWMFTKVIEYNDTHDDGEMKSVDAQMSHKLDVLQWQDANATIHEADNSATLTSTMSMLGENATLSLHLRAFGDSDRLKTLPHLQHTENTTQVDLTLQDLMSNYLNSRFAVEMMMVGSSNQSLSLKVVTSIDDEYTPAVFSTLDLNVPDSPMGSYLQWKPVSYTLKDRAMENSRHVYEYNLDTKRDQLNIPNTSIAHAYFSPEEMGAIGALNISFGITKDGFYKETNYLSWSANFGYGEAPEENMTLTVYIVISAGLGIPLIIVVFGGAGVCVSKHRQKKRRMLLTN